MNDYLRGIDIICEDVVNDESVVGAWYKPWTWGDSEEDYTFVETPTFDAGMKRLSILTKEMAKLKNMTVAQAGVLVQAGLIAVNDAIREAARQKKIPFWTRLMPITWAFAEFKASQIPPSSTARQKVYWKLDWHRKEIEKLVSMPNALYPYANDLKNWVAQAYVEEVTKKEAGEFIDDLWLAMWKEIGARGLEVVAAPIAAVNWLRKVPTWAWILGGVVVVGVAYKLVLAVAPVVVGGYLPRK